MNIKSSHLPAWRPGVVLVEGAVNAISPEGRCILNPWLLALASNPLLATAGNGAQGCPHQGVCGFTTLGCFSSSGMIFLHATDVRFHLLLTMLSDELEHLFGSQIIVNLPLLLFCNHLDVEW